MKVRAVFRPGAITAGAVEDLTQAACRMGLHGVGALLVVENGAPVGILTERDILRAVAGGADPSTAIVVRYMSPDPVTVSVDAEISEAAATMLRIGARHLPVVEDDRVVGMISARDVLTDEVRSEEGRR